MVQGGMSCIKYLMFFFNFLFVICGLALVILGGISLGKNYTEFLDSKFVTAPVILIVVGLFIFGVAFLGCCGALKENHCMVMTFGLLLFVIFIVELAGGISAYVYRGQVQNFLKQNMNESIHQQKEDAIKVWDDIQSGLKCCGVDSANDYTTAGIKIPKSCCPDDVDTCSATNAYDKGCYPLILDLVKQIIAVVGGVAIGLAVIELLGCMFAWCLASAIKRDYEGV